MKTITTKEIRLETSCFDTLGIDKEGNYVGRTSFFYTKGRTAEDLANRVRLAYPNAAIVSQGEVWKNFRDGASVAQQSHWYVKFKLV